MARLARNLRGLEPEHERTKSTSLKQEPQRRRTLRRLQVRGSRPLEFAESSGNLPGMAKSSTCAAKCPSATASGVVATSIRNRRFPSGRPRPTTIRDSRCTEGHLTPDNVRLAHRLCNQRDYIWRKKINALLGKRMSLEEIAAKLNAEKVPAIHGTNRWTAVSVRKAFVSQKRSGPPGLRG